MLRVKRTDLEDILTAISSARDFLTALDTAHSINLLEPVVKLNPLTKLVDEQTEKLAILLRPEFPPES